MRLIIILILAALCLNFKTMAQPSLLETKVSLQYHEVALERVISELRKSYGVHFSYVNNLISLNQKVTVDIKDQSLKIALDELFKNMDVSCQVVGSQVVLKNEQKDANTIEQLNYNSIRPAYIPSIDGLVLLADGSDPADLYVGNVTIRPSQPDTKGYTFSDNVVAGISRVVDELEKAVQTTSTQIGSTSAKIDLNNFTERSDKVKPVKNLESEAKKDTYQLKKQLKNQIVM